MEDAVAGADLVIEAVPEIPKLKQAVFSQLDEFAPKHAVLGTNTSSLSIDMIAQATSRPDKVIGMHFFNPVPIMQLLELVKHETTSQATIDFAKGAAETMGKTSILVKDVPGFATSRLGVVLGNEAIRMLADGVASAEDIDTAMVLGYKHPMGPLRLTDLVGLDVRLAIAEHLWKEVGEQFRPPNILRKMVRAGKLGKKTGEGFYHWD